MVVECIWRGIVAHNSGPRPLKLITIVREYRIGFGTISDQYSLEGIGDLQMIMLF